MKFIKMRNPFFSKLLRNIHYGNRVSTKRWKSLNSIKTNNWESVIGLEIHAQLNSKSKLFSGAANTFGAAVNNCVALFDASIPGTLPVLNRRCVELAVMTALATSCKVNEVSMFDRKHYFYADLPAGYQITQQRAPLASDGELQFQVFRSGSKKPYLKSSKIKQIQLEQDSGKSLHDEEMNKSLVDLNRAGAPLIELVFEPDLKDGEEAAALIKELILILQRIGSCSGRMEEGALRVDANISINRPKEPLGVRTEIKNIGSVRGVAAAVKHEIERQIALKESGGRVVNETRMWDAASKTTIVMRDKEVVQDYRFMPEPNLPPLRLNIDNLTNASNLISVPTLKNKIPELPEQTRQNLIQKYNITLDSAIRLVSEPKLLNYFYELVNLKSNLEPNKIVNILTNELVTSLNKNNVDLSNCKIQPLFVEKVLLMLRGNQINLETTELIFDEYFKSKLENASPTEIVQQNNWLLTSDENVIREICIATMNENPKLVKMYRDGKEKMLYALLGIVKKKSKDKVNMSLASQILEKVLKK